MVCFADGHYEITRVGNLTVQLADRAGLIAKAQALLQLDQPAAGDQVGDEGQ